MANRRVSELNELLSTQLAPSDLFLISDVSAIESKKIRASELKSFSLNGTASYALNSLSSSYAFRATSASWSPATVSASYALSASYADWAKTASYVISASYALSSSFSSMSFWAITASYALTSSTQLVISSGLADLARSASYLIYTNGFNNGTSSAAISASWVRFALTSSYLLYNGIPNGTASYALTSSVTTTASFAKTSSFLNNDGITFNGSASYAQQAETAYMATYTQKPMLWDVYTATVTNYSESRISSMSFARPYDGFGWSYTFVTFTGTVIVNFTGSATCSFNMIAHDTIANLDYVLDRLPLTYSIHPDQSSSISVPITLQGAGNLANSTYYIYVTASNYSAGLSNIRSGKFKIESAAQNVVQLV